MVRLLLKPILAFQSFPAHLPVLTPPVTKDQSSILPGTPDSEYKNLSNPENNSLLPALTLTLPRVKNKTNIPPDKELEPFLPTLNHAPFQGKEDSFTTQTELGHPMFLSVRDYTPLLPVLNNTLFPPVLNASSFLKTTERISINANQSIGDDLPKLKREVSVRSLPILHSTRSILPLR